MGFNYCFAGFKYIGNTALALEKEGYEVPFGYEEAIGFMFGSQLRDKDGVAASVSIHLLSLEGHHSLTVRSSSPSWLRLCKGEGRRPAATSRNCMRSELARSFCLSTF